MIETIIPALSGKLKDLVKGKFTDYIQSKKEEEKKKCRVKTVLDKETLGMFFEYSEEMHSDVVKHVEGMIGADTITEPFLDGFEKDEFDFLKYTTTLSKEYFDKNVIDGDKAELYKKALRIYLYKVLEILVMEPAHQIGQAQELAVLKKELEELKKSFVKLFAQYTEHVENSKVLSVKGKPRIGKESDYYEQWTDSLFLEDEDGKCLKDVHVLPEYYDKKKPRDDLKSYLKGMIDRKEGSPYAKKKLSLILGGPGYGKSTLYSYLLNMDDVKCVETEDGDPAYLYGDRRIFLYRFCDMKADVNWNEESMQKTLNQILAHIGVQNESELSGTILLFDGFDECDAADWKRTEILKAMANRWGNKSRIYVTCRENYIRNEQDLGQKISCINLKSFNRAKIQAFIGKYKNLDLNKRSTKKIAEGYLERMMGKENEHEVFGIPIVLYMVMAMEEEIGLRSDFTIGRVYKELFRKENGIYDRMLINERYEIKKDKHEFARFDIGDKFEAYKAYLERVSHCIAHYMFEHAADNTADFVGVENYIKKKEGLFQDKNGEDVSISTILSSGMFMYVDGAESKEGSIRYVHKSMYEYFMADCIYQQIRTFYEKMSGSDADQKRAVQELHKNLAILFRKGVFTKEIVDFLKDMLSDTCQQNEEIGEFKEFENAFREMLKKGMLWYLLHTQEIYDEIDAMKVIDYQEVLNTWDAQVFENLMYLIQIFRKAKGIYPTKQNHAAYLFGKKEENRDIAGSFARYLRMKHYSGIKGNGKENSGGFDLAGINLSRMDLSNTDMSRYDLSYTDAEGTSFRKSILNGTNFTETLLKDAAFTGASLILTIPSAESLFDDPRREIPWTEFTGYYPEKLEGGCDENGAEILESIKKDGFGRYPQKSADSKDKDPIKWRVLEVRGNRALLLSEQILDVRRYMEKYMDTNWKKSDIRKWLNCEEKGGFLYEAFLSGESRADYRRICQTLVEPHRNINPSYTTQQGESTIDRVFLLSGEEALKYFAGKGKKMSIDGWEYEIGSKAIATPTEYSHSKGLGASGNPEWWWVRSVGRSATRAMTVDRDGSVRAYGSYVSVGRVGVRPALWITLKS